MIRISVLFSFLLFYSVMQAQVGIGTATPSNSAQLDVQSTDKGMLVPRIGLTAANSAAPVAAPADALLIYNTAMAGSGVNAVKPGFYYWLAAASRWVAVGASSTEGDVGYGAWGNGTAPAYVSGFNPVSVSDGTTGAAFGQSVSISGNYAIIGASNQHAGKNTYEGTAYIFRFDGHVWVLQQKLIAADGADSTRFGYSVSISGNYAIVGAPRASVSGRVKQGAAYIYFFNGTSWVQFQKLTASDGAAGDEFGTSVGISGSNAIIGAMYDDVGSNIDQGSAYIFSYSSAWTQQTRLTAPDGTGYASFGMSVGISTDKIIVGASKAVINVPGNIGHGAAYTYLYNGAIWKYLQKLTGAELFPVVSVGPRPVAQEFGTSVAISGNYAIVGGPHILKNGGAYVYIFDKTSWNKSALLLASDGAPGDEFGYSVSISGNYAVAGARSDEIGFNSSQGSAYVFRNVNEVWKQAQKISDPSGNTSDEFGTSCIIDNGRLAVGAIKAGSLKGTCFFGMIN